MGETVIVRRPLLLLLGSVLVLLLAGCGDEQAAEPGRGETKPPAGETGEETATAPAIEAATTFGAYFLRGEHVAPVFRQVPQTEAVGTAALEALLQGPNAAEQSLGVTSSIPAETRLLGLDVQDGTAAVDLSPEFGTSGTQGMASRLAQVTFTLTQFSSVERVWVAVQGEPVYLLGLNEPLTRDRFAELTPLILVEQPALGETVSSPLQVQGTASVFEATLRVRLVGPDDETLWEDTVTAGEGAPGRGSFAVGIPFSASGDGKVVVFSPSAADGSEQHTFEVPVTLAP